MKRNLSLVGCIPERMLSVRVMTPGGGGGGYTPLYDLYGDVLLDRIWFWPFCPEQGI